MSNKEMKYVPLGRCGMKVSKLSLGGWTTFGDSVVDQPVIREILQTAFDSGINYFDISDIYNLGNTERAMGAVLGDFPRHEIVIASKVFFPMSDDVNDRGLSRKHIMESVDKSLQRIGTDYLDIYFCHRFDAETLIEETARAMDDLVHQGKVLYWGTSEWTGEQINQAHEICNKRNLYCPQVEQPVYNMLSRKNFETDVQPSASRLGMGLVTFSPLAHGVLTGKYDNGIPQGARLDQIEWLRGSYYNEECLNRVRQMETYSNQLGCTRAQLALAWIATNPAVSSIITGATRVDQLKDNLGGLKVKLDDSMIDNLNKLFPL